MIGYILIYTAINLVCFWCYRFYSKRKYNTLFGFRSNISNYLLWKLFISRRNVNDRTFKIMC